MEACCLICTLSIDLSLSFSLPPWKPMLYLLEANIIFFGANVTFFWKVQPFWSTKVRLIWDVLTRFMFEKYIFCPLNRLTALVLGVVWLLSGTIFLISISSDWFGWLGEWVTFESSWKKIGRSMQWLRLLWNSSSPLTERYQRKLNSQPNEVDINAQDCQ